MFFLLYLVLCRMFPRKHGILGRYSYFMGPWGIILVIPVFLFSTQTSACHTDISNQPPSVLNLTLIIPPL